MGGAHLDTGWLWLPIEAVIDIHPCMQPWCKLPTMCPSRHLTAATYETPTRFVSACPGAVEHGCSVWQCNLRMQGACASGSSTCVVGDDAQKPHHAQPRPPRLAQREGHRQQPHARQHVQHVQDRLEEAGVAQDLRRHHIVLVLSLNLRLWRTFQAMEQGSRTIGLP